jgi:outer membrane protein assembly factor BamB
MLHDKDLGASGPMIVAARNGSGVSHLALQAGKFGGIKVINRDQGSVGSVGGARVIRNPGGDAEVGAPFARWTNPTDHSLWVFFSDDHAISGFELVPRAKSTALALRWTRTAASTSEWNTLYAAPPMLANNVLFQQRGGVIEALDPTTGNLWWSDATLKRVHRNGPILANGTLYIVDLGNDVAYPSLFAWSLH